jgi:hypothetical protein
VSDEFSPRLWFHWPVTDHNPEPGYRAEAKRADRRIKLIFGIVLWLSLAALDGFIIKRDSSRPGPLPTSVWLSIGFLIIFGLMLVRIQLRQRRKN